MKNRIGRWVRVGAVDNVRRAQEKLDRRGRKNGCTCWDLHTKPDGFRMLEGKKYVR